MYSQGSEQQAITNYFGDFRGRWLDVGAFDGVCFSNTLRLAELGWSGLSVEPDPHAFCKLLDNYAARNISGVQCLHAFVGDKLGITTFYGTGGDAVNTASEEQREEWSAHVKYRRFFVPVITVWQVLQHFGAIWDMVNLDVEGTNLAVLRTMPLAEMQTKLICVEHQTRHAEVKEYCAEHGLTEELMRNAENIILARPN